MLYMENVDLNSVVFFPRVSQKVFPTTSNYFSILEVYCLPLLPENFISERRINLVIVVWKSIIRRWLIWRMRHVGANMTPLNKLMSENSARINIRRMFFLPDDFPHAINYVLKYFFLVINIDIKPYLLKSMLLPFRHFLRPKENYALTQQWLRKF